jgi:hypothetical protein
MRLILSRSNFIKWNSNYFFLSQQDIFIYDKYMVIRDFFGMYVKTSTRITFLTLLHVPRWLLGTMFTLLPKTIAVLTTFYCKQNMQVPFSVADRLPSWSWWLYLELRMQSVPITTIAMSSNPTQARCTRYNIM